jgi:fructose/tagatose bisphosphate aldolase
VFHGGSGSTKEEINTAVGNGVVKMNVDTDTQYAYLIGIRVRYHQIIRPSTHVERDNVGLCPEKEGLPPKPNWQP